MFEDDARRSSGSPIGGRLKSGMTLCAAVSLAAWLCPLSSAYADADEVELSGEVNSSDQLAQAPAVPARDTTVPRGQTVLERQRPELDPLGVRVGSFNLFPVLGVREEYNDNIFATDSDAKGDFITKVSPQVRLNSNWNNHSLGFFGGAEVGRHNNNGAEDYEDFNVGADGRLDVRRDTRINARAEFQNKHEERGSPDDVGGIEPTEVNAIIGQLEGYHRLNRVNFTLGGAVQFLDFEDASTAGGGTINNDDRDRYEAEASLRVGYEVVPNYEAFVRGTYLKREYDSLSDGPPALDRDSDGVEIVAGVRIDFGGITYGDFFAGYRRQDYDDPVLKTISGPTVGADITWNVTPLTTIIGTVSRVIEESTTGDGLGSFASGRFVTTGGVSAQHELRRNLLLGANVSYSNDDYEGIDRTDNVLKIGVNANYMMYRNLYIRGGLQRRSKDSDVAGKDYVENLAFVGLQAQY